MLPEIHAPPARHMNGKPVLYILFSLWQYLQDVISILEIQVVKKKKRNTGGKQCAQGLCLASDQDSLLDQTLTRFF